VLNFSTSALLQTKHIPTLKKLLYRVLLITIFAGSVFLAASFTPAWATALLALASAAALSYPRAAVQNTKQNALQTQQFAQQKPDSTLIESLPDPLIQLDTQLRIVATNASARTLLGGLVTNDPIDFYLRQPNALETVRSALAEGHTTHAELTILSPLERFYHLRAIPLSNNQGILIAMTDVTQQRLADKTRVDFVANASHELRTPLATLIGFIETLQGPAANDREARVRFLDIMSREASRMSRLIDELLSLSRVEISKHIKPVAPLDITPLLRDVGRTLAMRLEQDQRRIVLNVPQSLPLVLADRDQILQVLHNLVSNALKYGRTGSAIDITAEIEHTPLGQDFVSVCVSDEGDGIPAEHIPRLTERFYRVDTARSRTLGGTGLGLAIVKHILERHGSELIIKSQLGIGTKVSFLLPIALSEPRPATYAPDASQK
jgi:two-component system, OmpR family, phosphate regulon sensor histidine kinase PhoR